jgi:hypothetical protein
MKGWRDSAARGRPSLWGLGCPNWAAQTHFNAFHDPFGFSPVCGLLQNRVAWFGVLFVLVGDVLG